MNLFNRQTTVRAHLRQDRTVEIEVLFSDTVHEIDGRFTFSPEDGTVVAARAEFLRCPYDICQATVEKMEALRGIAVGPGSTKAVRDALGGCEGCEHLVEVTLEAFKVFVQCRFRLAMEEQGGVAKTFEHFKDTLKDTCYPYTHPDRIGEIRWWGRLPVDLVDKVKKG